MENTEHTEGQGVNRRSFIKRAAATGGVVIFAAPAIQTVVASAAQATTGASTPPEGCFHSTGTNGGCMPTCTSTGATGKACGAICGNGQVAGGCPVGQGGNNPCASDGYCDPACYQTSSPTEVVFVC